MSEHLSFSPIIASKVDLLVVAGEASGDEHASRLIKKLKFEKPEMKIAALGGRKLKESGAELLFDLVDHAVVGIFEVLKNYGFFRRLFDLTIQWISRNSPKAILLVDYPGFNLRLARALKKMGISTKGGGRIPVLQYVGPQLWAWKAKRRFDMEEVLDALAVIFPFELNCYKDVSLPVSFVGHPFACSSYKSPVAYDPKGDLLLLPGSRAQPVSRILPVFLDAFEILLSKGHDFHSVLPYSDPKIGKLSESIISHRSQETRNRVKVMEKKDGGGSCSARAALMSSGTMSLACAWAGIPGVIAYKAHPLTYLLGKLLVKVSYLGMANLLLPDNPPNAEFLQGEAKGSKIANGLEFLLDDSSSGKRAEATAGMLQKMLSEGEQKTVVEWLLQAGKLA